MDFWTLLIPQDGESEPTFLKKLTDLVKDDSKDDALSSAVGFLAEAWLTLDGCDDEEPQRKKKKPEDGTFEERLQRSLSELQQQASAPAAPAAPVIASPLPTDVPVAPIQPPMPRLPMRGAGGFGRKGL